MIRPAAGGCRAADGRNRGAARPRSVRRGTVLRGSLLFALLTPLVTTGEAAALAAPMQGAASAPATAGAPVDDTSDPARPVQIVISRLEPRAITPAATITVAFTLTNKGSQPITDLGVRLQRGRVVNTRAEFAALGRDPDPSTTVAAPFQAIPVRLDPGASFPFTYSVPAAQLQLTQDGVYPALLNLNGTVGGQGRQRVGEVSTFLVEQPSSPAAHTTVAWLWPFVDRTHRDASGQFTDDELAKEVAAGGRLDRALAAVERVPRTTLPGATAATPSAPVTLAVDPALLEELAIMAAGTYPVEGQGNGKGTDAARAFLARLRTVAAEHEVVTLPYGDIDAESLVPAGLHDVVARALPGLPAGNGPDPGTGTPAPPSASGDGSASNGGASAGAAQRIVSSVLGVEGRTALAWASAGTLHAETLDTLRSGGIGEIVVAGSALSDGQAALGMNGGRTMSRAALTLPSGSLTTVLGDFELGDLAGTSAHAAGGPRLAEQRYLAVLTVLALQSPGDPATGQTVLVAPPREVDVDPSTAAAMMADTAALPWLRPSPLTQLAADHVGDAGSLAPATAASGGLDGAGLSAVAAAVAARNALLGALVDRRDIEPYDAAIARTTSVAWRTHPKQFRAAAAELRAQLDGLRGRVTLLAPADGTYSLASSDAPLVLTVRNDLPFTVRVRLQLRTRGNVGLSIGDIGTQQLAPHSRTTLQVPTKVGQSGRFLVTAALTTPDGGALGDRVQFQVKSTAYGPVTMVITIGAAALLGLLFLRRLIRFLLRRRRGAPQAGELLPEPGAEGAAVSPPPARSPV